MSTDVKYRSGDATISSTTQLFPNPKTTRRTRLLYTAVLVLVIAVLGLVIALVLVANRSDEDDEKQVGTAAGLTTPICPRNPNSLTPELDQANCILESYPLIDG